MNNYLKQLFKELTCKHAWRYSHSQPDTTQQGYRVTRTVYECMKCGSIKSAVMPKGE